MTIHHSMEKHSTTCVQSSSRTDVHRPPSTLQFPVTLYVFSPQTSCSELDAYLRGPLGKYLLNISMAAEWCSQTLCSSHGRCLRKNPDSDVYLHLDPVTHSVVSKNGKLSVTGELGEAEMTRFHADFQCQCYSGYEGGGCDKTDPLHQRGAACRATASVLQQVILLIVSVNSAHIL